MTHILGYEPFTFISFHKLSNQKGKKDITELKLVSLSLPQLLGLCCRNVSDLYYNFFFFIRQLEFPFSLCIPVYRNPIRHNPWKSVWLMLRCLVLIHNIVGWALVPSFFLGDQRFQQLEILADISISAPIGFLSNTKPGLHYFVLQAECVPSPQIHMLKSQCPIWWYLEVRPFVIGEVYEIVRMVASL